MNREERDSNACRDGIATQRSPTTDEQRRERQPSTSPPGNALSGLASGIGNAAFAAVLQPLGVLGRTAHSTKHRRDTRSASVALERVETKQGHPSSIASEGKAVQPSPRPAVDVFALHRSAPNRAVARLRSVVEGHGADANDDAALDLAELLALVAGAPDAGFGDEPAEEPVDPPPAGALEGSAEAPGGAFQEDRPGPATDSSGDEADDTGFLAVARTARLLARQNGHGAGSTPPSPPSPSPLSEELRLIRIRTAALRARLGVRNLSRERRVELAGVTTEALQIDRDLRALQRLPAGERATPEAALAARLQALRQQLGEIDARIATSVRSNAPGRVVGHFAAEDVRLGRGATGGRAGREDVERDPVDPRAQVVVGTVTGSTRYRTNPSSTSLASQIDPRTGRIAGRFRDGRYMYVVDDAGNVLVGVRHPAGAGTTQPETLPHPTLIGGQSPRVQAAGMVHIQRGQIVGVNNASGHFQPPSWSQWRRNAEAAFRRLGERAFHRRFGEVGFRTFDDNPDLNLPPAPPRAPRGGGAPPAPPPAGGGAPPPSGGGGRAGGAAPRTGSSEASADPQAPTTPAQARRTSPTASGAGPGPSTPAAEHGDAPPATGRGRQAPVSQRVVAPRIGMAVAGTIGSALVAYLETRLRERIDRSFIEMQLRRLEPEIQRQMTQRTEAARALARTSPDSLAYFNIVFRLTQSGTHADPRLAGSSVAHLPHVALESVTVNAVEVAGELAADDTRQYFGGMAHETRWARSIPYEDPARPRTDALVAMLNRVMDAASPRDAAIATSLAVDFIATLDAQERAAAYEHSGVQVFISSSRIPEATRSQISGLLSAR